MQWKPDIVIDLARGGSDDFHPVISNQVCERKCQNQKKLQLQPDIHHGVAIMDVWWAVKCPEEIDGQKHREVQELKVCVVRDRVGNANHDRFPAQCGNFPPKIFDFVGFQKPTKLSDEDSVGD